MSEYSIPRFIGNPVFVDDLAVTPSGIENTLQERGKRYGNFSEHAAISQDLKDVMYASNGWAGLNKTQREALEMIQHKVARILNGDPNYVDSWHDIAGYSTLVERTLTEVS